MTVRASFDCDVLIVGAGPVGATLAGLLADEGLSVIACERSDEIYPLPRAAHLDHEAMRILQRLGVMDRVLPHTRPCHTYEFRATDGQVLMRFDSSAGRAAGGWPASNMIYQPAVELALREKLSGCTNAELRLRWGFTSLEQNSAGVTAWFDCPQGTGKIRARYVIGCDGGSSVIRNALGVGLFDYGFDEPWLVVDVRVSDSQKLPAINLQICDPARPTTCVLMGPGRHRWEFMLRPGEEPGNMLQDGVVECLLAPWKLPLDSVVERRAVYRFHALVAEKWRSGFVLLAGDAAHQMPPFAGQGLCSGLRDAVNLSWKLAAVLRGEAGDTLLDTYQTERESHVRTIIDLALMMGRTVCVLDPVAAARRDKEMLTAQASGAMRSAADVSPPLKRGCLMVGSGGVLFPQPVVRLGDRVIYLDDIFGRAAWLITRGVAAIPRYPWLANISVSDERLALFRADILRWMDSHSAAAVLVRPDRYVFGVGDTDVLAEAYAAAFRPVAMHHA